MLVVTCTGVSFAHGSNDGQKGMGLIMLILIGIIPAVPETLQPPLVCQVPPPATHDSLISSIVASRPPSSQHCAELYGKQ